MTQTLTPSTIAELGSYRVANEADITFETETGAAFIRTTLATLAEHLTYADDPAEALRYFAEADGAALAVDFDLSDLAHAVADAVASRYVYNADVAETWVAVCGWQVDDEVSDVGDARDTLGRMRLGLYLVADRIVWAAHRLIQNQEDHQ